MCKSQTFLVKSTSPVVCPGVVRALSLIDPILIAVRFHTARRLPRRRMTGNIPDTSRHEAGSGTIPVSGPGGGHALHCPRTISRSSRPTKPSPDGSASGFPGGTAWFHTPSTMSRSANPTNPSPSRSPGRTTHTKLSQPRPYKFSFAFSSPIKDIRQHDTNPAPADRGRPAWGRRLTRAGYAGRALPRRKHHGA